MCEYCVHVSAEGMSQCYVCVGANEQSKEQCEQVRIPQSTLSNLQRGTQVMFPTNLGLLNHLFISLLLFCHRVLYMVSLHAVASGVSISIHIYTQ